MVKLLKYSASLLLTTMMAVMPASLARNANYNSAHAKGSAVNSLKRVVAEGNSFNVDLCEIADDEQTNILKTIQCNIGQVIDLGEVPTKDNYTFNGFWTEAPINTTPTGSSGTQYVDGDGNGIKPFDANTPTTLYAHWIGKQCEVLFYNPQGKRYSEYPNATGYYGSAFYYCANWPTELEKNEGEQVFLGWKRNGTDVFISKNDKITATKTRLVATFADKSTVQGYVVTLSAEGSDTGANEWACVTSAWVCSGKTCSQTFYGTTCLLGTLPEPRRTGYRFVGWGDGVSDRTVVNADVTYFAQWAPEVYSVSLTIDGEVSEVIEMEYGEAYSGVIKITEKVQRPHYDFLGYFGADGTQYFDGSGNNVTAWNIADSGALYAKYSPTEYAINYELNGGSLVVPNPTSYNIETDTFVLNNPTKEGYTFVGWQVDGSEELVQTVTIQKGSYNAKNCVAVFSAINESETDFITMVFNCTNYAGQKFVIYICDDNGKVVCEVLMTQAQLRLENFKKLDKYYIKFKLCYPNRVSVEGRENYVVGENCLTLITSDLTTYQINFSMTNITIINSIVL